MDGGCGFHRMDLKYAGGIQTWQSLGQILLRRLGVYVAFCTIP